MLARPIVSLILERGQLHPGRYRRNGRGAHVLRARPARLHRGEHRVADFLCASRQPHAGDRECASSVLLNVVLNLALVRVAGFRGLAAGTAISATVNGAVLLWLLRGRLGGLDGGKNTLAFVKITIASLLMGLAAWGGPSRARDRPDRNRDASACGPRVRVDHDRRWGCWSASRACSTSKSSRRRSPG